MTLSFWLILLAVLAYGLLHSLLASIRIKAQTQHRLGPTSERWYRLAYNLIAIGTLLPILVLPLILEDEEIYIIPFPWVILTIAIQLLAVVALFIGLRQTGITSFLGLRQAFLPEDTTPPRLVTDGLYRYVRHPLYTAGLLFIWLIAIMTWNLLALIIGLTAYIFVGIYFEERKLLQEFGSSYAKYRQSTPMLVPGLKSNRSHPIT
jgi:protein-S-isoprenylcysteine O-methyltransferase Ste14